jgi:hypothetical protein
MKTFTFLFCLITVLKLNAQVTGITVYSTNIPASSAARQPIAQAPNGDIYAFNLNTFGLTRFTAGTFTAMPGTVLLNGNPNLFATSSGVWLYNNSGDFYFYSGGTYTDYSTNITALIGPLSGTNPVNFAGTQGSNVLFGTRQGIIRFNGTSFNLITKSNSNLLCDTVYCILNNGPITYIGTHKGLVTYNGTAFSSVIPFNGAPSQVVNYVFEAVGNIYATRTDVSSSFNFYALSGTQLNRLPAYGDSLNFPSSVAKSMAYVGGPVFKGNIYPRLYQSASTFTTFVAPALEPWGDFHPFRHPTSAQRFYIVKLNPLKVFEVDVPTYTSYYMIPGPQTLKKLDTNNVSALIGATNIKHWDMIGASAYIVPKGSGIPASFASALWIGGLDNSGMLHISAETYRQTGQDFWPGPLDTITAQANSITGSPFNKVWKISCNMINQFAANANANNFAANSGTVFNDINTYIANGNNSNNFAKQLSPFYDGNNNGVYDPSLGEYPIIKGHQQIYSVYNDNHTTHTETKGLPLGVEVHERSFSYYQPALPDTMQVINNSTFYNFEVINRSNNNYNNVYMTIWADADLGYWMNDYVGTDTINEFGYIYNGTTTDPTAGGINGYGNKLPMFAFALMPRNINQSDGVDNNNNGQIDEPGERFKLNLATYYNNNSGPQPVGTTNPATKWQYYGYMSGRWKDSTLFKPGGSAYNPTLSVAPTRYVFTGNPQTSTGWTESTASLTPGDRRMLCTIGPFNFPAKKKVEFEYAYIFSRDTALNNVNNNFSLLQRDVKNVKHFANLQNKAACSPTVAVGITEQVLSRQNLWIYPNPANSELVINLSYNAARATVKLYDVTGRIIIESAMVNTYTAKLDLSQLGNGVYFVQISDGSTKLTQKLIKN